MRILLLILQFPPDVNSSGILAGQLADGLIELGHQVSVITSFPHYERFRVWPEYRGRLFQREARGALDVLRLWVYARGSKQRMLNRFASYASFNLLATAAGLASRRSYDLIFCSNGSFFSGLAAAAIGAARRLPYLLNVQDLYPETPIRAGQLRHPAAIAVLERLERFMYRRAAHITVIAPAFRQNLLGKGVPPEKVSVIPNFVDTDFIRPLPRDNPLARQLGLADRFVVTYAGNLGYVYDLDTLVEAAALLRQQPEILVLIVGDGVVKPRLEQRVAELGLTNVRFLPFQPREALPWLRAASDVQLSLYRPGSASYSMPSKVYEIMASGRPILASADRGSDVWRLVEEGQFGLCVDPLDPRALAEAILQLHRDPALRQAMGRHGRQMAEARFSRPAVVARYHQLLQQLAAPAG